MASSFQLDTSAHAERHYAVTEIAEMWNLSPDKVRELFENEPGVLVLGERSPRHKRPNREWQAATTGVVFALFGSMAL